MSIEGRLEGFIIVAKCKHDWKVQTYYSFAGTTMHCYSVYFQSDFLNGRFPASFSLFSSFILTLNRRYWSNKSCQWLDSNLWCHKQPLCQLSHNHCPFSVRDLFKLFWCHLFTNIRDLISPISDFAMPAFQNKLLFAVAVFLQGTKWITWCLLTQLKPYITSYLRNSLPVICAIKSKVGTNTNKSILSDVVFQPKSPNNTAFSCTQ